MLFNMFKAFDQIELIPKSFLSSELSSDISTMNYVLNIINVIANIGSMNEFIRSKAVKMIVIKVGAIYTMRRKIKKMKCRNSHNNNTDLMKQISLLLPQ